MDSLMPRGYHIQPTNSTCNIIYGFRQKGPSSSGRGKQYAVIFYLLSKSFINENYLDKYNKKMYVKIVLRWEFASVY